MHKPPPIFAQFVASPENRCALLAVQDVAEQLLSSRRGRSANPLLLHGPPGSGKSHLVMALAEEVRARHPERMVHEQAAGDFALPGPEQTAFDADNDSDVAADRDWLTALRHSDLLIVEDLQHLPAAAAGRLVSLIDVLLARGQQLVFTANAGPQQLQHRQGRFPARLTSRLAAGMVVRLEPLGLEGRLTLLRERAKHLPLNEAVLTWLAEHLTGGRELLGALRQLELLAQVQPGSLDVDTIARHFATQAEASKVTVEQIAQRVGHYFQVEAKQLQSRRRCRHILVPRQVSMYLARQLTGLSLEQIGAYFGGRDHTTVLHACRKVEEALDTDVALSGAIRELSTIGGQQSAREKGP